MVHGPTVHGSLEPGATTRAFRELGYIVISVNLGTPVAPRCLDDVGISVMVALVTSGDGNGGDAGDEWLLVTAVTLMTVQ